MTRYEVRETYTPDDPSVDRQRKQAEFVNESDDIKELAFNARLAILNMPTNPEMQEAARRMVEESADQLDNQHPDAFEIILFGNNGEWLLEVERLD